MRTLFVIGLLVGLLGAARAHAGEDRERAKAAMTKGAESYAAQDYQTAIKRYLEAIEAAPSAPGPYRELGKAYDALGDAKNARFSYEEYLSRKPDAQDASLIRDRLRVLAAASEDRDRAKSHMESGASAYLSRNYREALRQYQLALEAAPSASSPYREIGKTHDALAEYPQAKRAYETYLTKNPTAQDAALIRERLAAIEKLFRDNPSANPVVTESPTELGALRAPRPTLTDRPVSKGPRTAGLIAVSILLAGGITTAVIVSRNVEDDLLLP